MAVFTGTPPAASSKGGSLSYYEYHGIRVWRFDFDENSLVGRQSKIESNYNNFVAEMAYSQVLSQFVPDVVHFFHFSNLGTGLIERSVSAGIPSFMTPTDFWSVCATGQLMLPTGKHCRGPSAFSGNCIRHIGELSVATPLRPLIRSIPDCFFDLVGAICRALPLRSVPPINEIYGLVQRHKKNIGRINSLRKIVAPNNFIRDLLIRNGVRADKLIISPFGIEINPSRFYRRKKNGRGKRIVFGFIGTFAHHKGAHVLIKAFNELPEASAELRLYGRLGDYPSYSEELVAMAGANPSIKFLGTFDNKHIYEVLSKIDVLVVPSIWQENTPLVIYSAQAAGCVVVASDVEGVRQQVIHSVNGLVFTPGDSNALVSELLRLINDFDLLEDLERNQRLPRPIADYVDDLLGVWLGGNYTPELPTDG